jgi:putative ABC transport system permease protein
MDIDSMRELFGEEEDYINVLYSDEKMDIEEGRLYSVTSKEDIEHSSAVFLDIMMSLTVTLIIAGIVICCVVMYLMMAVMIDRSAMGISLIKIFGYRSNEVRKLYLNGNTAIVAIGGIITIPLAKLIIDSIYPSFIANVACSMNLHYPWLLYAGIYVGLLAIYFAVNALLLRKINRITPAEVLKDRE